jgi:N-acetylmuramoyl-L-alanine amidase
VHIIDRASWGARYPDGDDTSTLPASYVFLHHSATVAPDLVPPFTDDDAAVRQLEAIGQQRFGAGISYTFAVTPTGRVYEGHSVERQGTHTRNLNDAARAIVLVGNYATHRPTDAQVESVAQLLVHGWRKGWWRSPKLAGGHRDAPGAATECPGDHAETAIPIINARARQLAALDPKEATMTISDKDAERIAYFVWKHQHPETDAGGIKLPKMSASRRLDAIHRLGALGKLRDSELRKGIAALKAADLIDVDSIPELLTELGRRLYQAAPPAAAQPAGVRSLVQVPDVDDDEPLPSVAQLQADVDEQPADVEQHQPEHAAPDVVDELQSWDAAAQAPQQPADEYMAPAGVRWPA